MACHRLSPEEGARNGGISNRRYRGVGPCTQRWSTQLMMPTGLAGQGSAGLAYFLFGAAARRRLRRCLKMPVLMASACGTRRKAEQTL